MKKRIFAILLSALLVAHVCACNQATENEIDNSEDLAGNEVVDDTNASATKNAYESYDSIISEYRKTVELRFAEQAAADKYFSQLDNEKRELSEKIYSCIFFSKFQYYRLIFIDCPIKDEYKPKFNN